MTKTVCFLGCFFLLFYFCEAALERISPYEEKMLTLVNEEREKRGKPPLLAWDPVVKIAKEHSKSMASKKIPFGHDGFEKRAQKIRIFCSPESFGENVAYNKNCEDPLMQAFQGWMESSGHRDNILGDYTETGVGISIDQEGAFFFTQLFTKCK